MEYLGHCIDATGIHPTEKKLKAVKAAPMPTDASQLRTFIGLMNYYGKFIPHIATHLAPLYKLLEKDHDQKWVWSEECESTFLSCQSLLTSDVTVVLVHYDSEQPLKLACDASSYGLGVVLSHVSKEGERPIAFASRTLTKQNVTMGKLRRKPWL